jgi:hypothetical protein
MRIGISYLSHENQSIWLGGMLQNVVFLAQALARLPFVSGVVLIDTGTERALPREATAIAPELRVMTQHEAGDMVDVIIEIGSMVDVQWLDLMRARGRKVISFCRSQPLAALAEPMLFERPVPNLRPDRYDEIWLLHKDRMFAPMLRSLHRCPVHQVPFIWAPSFVAGRCAELAEHGVRYEYAAYAARRATDQGAWRVAIFEPNRSVIKAASIPMLLCDEAERAAPGTLQFMYAVNTMHMKEHQTMLHLANSLDLVRSHRASFESRHDTASFLAQYADAVVSHQWTCEQNYLYFDVLYGDYPLIHNSPWLAESGVGYYYPDFDPKAGARVLLDAHARHDAGLAQYRARAQALFEAVHPFARANLDAYARRLQALSAAPAAKAGA